MGQNASVSIHNADSVMLVLASFPFVVLHHDTIYWADAENRSCFDLANIAVVYHCYADGRSNDTVDGYP